MQRAILFIDPMPFAHYVKLQMYNYNREYLLYLIGFHDARDRKIHQAIYC